MKAEACPHVPADEAAPRAPSCERCGATFNLRACTTCGHVGCCESQQAHNTAHWRESGHPVIRAVARPPGAGFLWCYECGDYLR